MPFSFAPRGARQILIQIRNESNFHLFVEGMAIPARRRARQLRREVQQLERRLRRLVRQITRILEEVDGINETLEDRRHSLGLAEYVASYGGFFLV